MTASPSPVVTSRSPRIRGRIARVGVAAAILTLVSPVAWAQAVEGPGYGGTGDALSVEWVAPTEATTTEPVPVDQPADPAPVDQPADPAPEAPAAPTDVIEIGGGPGAAMVVSASSPPTLEPDRLQLQVNGLGFRAKSSVIIRVGDAAPVTTRSDTAGSLDIAIDPALLGGAQPGLSVVAIGRNPAGTAVTLYGSVPPEPSGTGPMTLIPWAALSIALVTLALWLRRRHHDVGRHDRSGPEAAHWGTAVTPA